jgi:hypothetical protein
VISSPFNGVCGCRSRTQNRLKNGSRKGSRRRRFCRRLPNLFVQRSFRSLSLRFRCFPSDPCRSQVICRLFNIISVTFDLLFGLSDDRHSRRRSHIDRNVTQIEIALPELESPEINRSSFDRTPIAAAFHGSPSNREIKEANQRRA